MQVFEGVTVFIKHVRLFAGILGVSLILAASVLRRTVSSTDLTRVNVQSVVVRRETFMESNHEKLLATELLR